MWHRYGNLMQKLWLFMKPKPNIPANKKRNGPPNRFHLFWCVCVSVCVRLSSAATLSDGFAASSGQFGETRLRNAYTFTCGALLLSRDLLPDAGGMYM